jgi:hypothetical protein
VRLVRQACTAVTVAFDDVSVADFFDELVDRGLKPEQFARVWLHTHPGNSADPSSVDEETFARSFGNTDWAVMAILARGGQRFARLQFHAGPGGALALPVQVDYARPFPAADPAAWEAEYQQCVQPVLSSRSGPHWLEPVDADADFSLSPWGELAWGWEPDFEERSVSRDASRTL